MLFSSRLIRPFRTVDVRWTLQLSEAAIKANLTVKSIGKQKTIVFSRHAADWLAEWLGFAVHPYQYVGELVRGGRTRDDDDDVDRGTEGMENFYSKTGQSRGKIAS